MSTIIVTHNGIYHSDDVFSVATIIRHLKSESFEIIRTRDEDHIARADFVVDVGNKHDASRNRFDHHQEGGAGERENGIPYASFGLVWKKYGEEICGSAEVATEIDERLVQPIDAADNGIAINEYVFEGVSPYTIQDLFASFLPSWKEENEESVNIDDLFRRCVDLALLVLDREIRRATDILDAETYVREAYERAEDKRVVVFDRRYPWKSVLLEYPEPVFVVYPIEENNTWHVRGVPPQRHTFDVKVEFPELWTGKRDQDLVDVTGVPDALFCHNKRFLAVARTKEGAVTLAQKALQ